MGRLFGADGARGIAVTELTCDLAMQVGKAFAHILKSEQKSRPVILVGRDVRITSELLESALCAGIRSVGADVLLTGVIPAPAASFLVKKYSCDGAVMISASRGGADYNGIRILSSSGGLISEEQEEDIESLVLDFSEQIRLVKGTEIGGVSECENAVQTYVDSLAASVKEPLGRMRIAIDCANGCTSHTAETLLTRLGAEVMVINADPDGINVNDDCGATHIEGLMDFVREQQCDLGLAFDGDGLRCLAVDELGEMVDGDKLLAIFTKEFQKQGRLRHQAVVVTVLSNLGFSSFARQNGIRPVSSNTGERYVLEKLVDGGFVLGGEQSGYIAFPEEFPVSDGLRTGMRLLEILQKSGTPLSELGRIMEKFPQVMVNVHIPEEKKENWKNDDVITDLIDKRETELGDAGRILVRESNADAMIRVMVEGKNFRQINAIAMEISDTIRSRVGK